jgi:hypothetical protein
MADQAILMHRATVVANERGGANRQMGIWVVRGS